MFNVADIIAIAVVVLSALVAFKKGFVKTFFGFVSTFIAIILAFAFCTSGVELIKQNTELDERLEITLTNAFDKKEKDDIAENEPEETKQSSNFVTEAFSELPKALQDVVGMEEYKNNLKTTLVEKSVDIILKVLSWIIIYLIVRLVLFILCLVFNGIMNIPFLKQINNLAGLILGAIVGLLRVYIVLAFISFLVSFISMEGLLELIKNSFIVGAMYDNNLLLQLIF